MCLGTRASGVRTASTSKRKRTPRSLGCGSSATTPTSSRRAPPIPAATRRPGARARAGSPRGNPRRGTAAAARGAQPVTRCARPAHRRRRAAAAHSTRARWASRAAAAADPRRPRRRCKIQRHRTSWPPTGTEAWHALPVESQQHPLLSVYNAAQALPEDSSPATSRSRTTATSPLFGSRAAASQPVAL